MLASFAPDTGGTLVLANGVYGERMAAMLKAHGKPHLLQQQGWLEAVDLAARRDAGSRQPEHHAPGHGSSRNHHGTTERPGSDWRAVPGPRTAAAARWRQQLWRREAPRVKPGIWRRSRPPPTSACMRCRVFPSCWLARSEVAQRRAAGAAASISNLHAYHKGQHGDGFSPFTQAVQVAFALREALAELAEGRRLAGARRALLGSVRVLVHAALDRAGVRTLLDPAEYSLGTLVLRAAGAGVVPRRFTMH